jgi:hypothetical protein
MPFQKTVSKFTSLVSKVYQRTTARSENDLSSNLAFALKSLGLSTVIDTSVVKMGRKRPDILGYVSGEDADLVLPAEIVVEAKKPHEVAEFADLAEAVVSGWIWDEKTVPYVRANITRIQYFVLTTFTEFAILPVTESLRRQFIAWRYGEDSGLRVAVRAGLLQFQLAPALPDSDPRSTAAWISWVSTHFTPPAIAPIAISQIHNALAIENRADLEGFATRLADFAAGSADNELTNAGLFYSVRASLPSAADQLDPLTRRDLHIFLMTQHPGMNLEAVEQLAKENPVDVVDEFVAASIHSLIGRLFAFKAIEDIYCLREPEPLINAGHWIFATNRYDGKSAEEIRTEAFQALRALKTCGPSAIQRFAVYGFFFDWIERYIDPVVFRSLLEMLASHDFDKLEGDLLGRFFEIYGQKINRTKRRALGQYYTPQPIVELIWHLALQIVEIRGATNKLNVLDPGMGSGTFLTEGARVLGKLGIAKFWDRLTGFDISAQVLGIAYVNLYVSVLSQLDRAAADTVGDLRVYATDALDPKNGQYLRQILPLIPDEDYKRFIEQRIKISGEVKKAGSFTLVIGNPPYRNNSRLTLSRVATIFPHLLESSVRHARSQERNPRDDYAWFFAAADHYINDSGVIAFIVSDSFAQHLSYRYFRIDLLRHYHIRYLIRLGAHIFRDVGPRISFAIVILEKRTDVLVSADDAEAHQYVDLRSLVRDTRQNDLGTDEDPRFALMEEVVKGSAQLPDAIEHKPRGVLNYSLYSGTTIIERVGTQSAPIFERDRERLFSEKWPGLITAFDDLLKARTYDELAGRISGFFGLCRRRGLSTTKLAGAITKWANDNKIDEHSLPRLEQLAIQIRQRDLHYNPSCIKRSLDGAMPNVLRWYPPRSNTVYIYYEVRLDIPRNKNEGKVIGWGSMQQWRDPRSHTIRPKLIYTTASKPNYGLKAFVVDDEWYVKLHGGTSQQYNYTGLVTPTRSGRMDGSPNNLAPQGLELFASFAQAGLQPDAFIFYIATIYNSQIATEFMEQAGSGTPFGIKLPAAGQMQIANRLSSAGRSMRDLSWLRHLAEGAETLDATILSQFSSDFLQKMGIVKKESSSRRFKRRETYLIESEFAARVTEAVETLQEEVDELSIALYS